MLATSIRLDDDTLARLDSLAEYRNCSRASLIKEAVDKYLEYDAWFLAEVQKGLDEANAGKLVSHENVKEGLRARGLDVD